MEKTKRHRLIIPDNSRKGNGYELIEHYASKLSDSGEKEKARALHEAAKKDDYEFNFVLKLIAQTV